MTTILLVEIGSTELLAAIEAPLRKGGYTVHIVSCDQVGAQFGAQLIIAGHAASSQLLTRRLPVPLIITSAELSTREAIAAMRGGAADVLLQPFDESELLASVERQVNPYAHQARHDEEEDAAFPGMIGRCDAMRALFAQMRKVAPVESTVLIQGESGTGKELVARALHARSRRSGAPIISLNCAAIPEGLIESELFGHESGAFGGSGGGADPGQAQAGLVEAADGGTLFLDEIGELPAEAQARLLRVLQEGEIRRVGSVATRQVDIRLIAATKRDLRRLTETEQFREDLFYRLNVVTLALPPLRERAGDMAALCAEILHKTCRKLNKPLATLSPDAIAAITGYHWPGNIRELENAIERAVILSEHNATELPRELLAIEPHQPAAQPALAEAQPGKGATTLDDYFIQFVQENQDSMTETELAQKLGISRKSLWERRQRFKIPRQRTKKRGLRST